MQPTEQRINILGTHVDSTAVNRAITACEELLASSNAGYVCVTGVHGVMEAQRNSDLRAILNNSFLTVPDGMPLVWVGRLTGHRAIRRVYGPEFMIEFCRSSVKHGYRHFLYGGNEGVADELAERLQQTIPGINIVGTFTPPFRPLNAAEEHELATLVAECKPDCFWVGISTPKQEQFMAKYISQLDTKLMVGVGAAFDIHTGRIQDAPAWMKNAGLQWLHRLCQEPRRLWKRYLINNPKFICKITLQLTGIVRYS